MGPQHVAIKSVCFCQTEKSLRSCWSSERGGPIRFELNSRTWVCAKYSDFCSIVLTFAGTGFCIVGDAVYGSGDATFNDVDSCPDDEFFGLESHLISFVDDDGKRITASLSPEIEELFQDGKLHATDVEVAV